ncbi:MAG: NAD(P)-dependent glycerol-3-phosphate dehydrogenase [Candidatus Omnitrophica bacterium]|nr:NAD(P)-dependent glycerol-3-phosphate dehydrogenase [Candidatus Omnitrophota bacterium]MDD5592617.1 NAD(P)-dependent glycerol-3-phosphate dehydrogenase [Candidatus Omnitrophota bacterium]
MKKFNITVLGDGGWGATLAMLLYRKGFKVTLWGVFPDYISYLNKKRVNTRFLPGIRIPSGIEITSCLNEAVSDKDLLVLAIPSQYLRGILKRIKRLDYPRHAVYLSVTKGIEIGTLKRMSEVIRDEMGKIKLAVLSGPTVAHEVAKGIPTACVVASGDKDLRKYLQGIFMAERFRVYTNDDVIGVELGGSLKNVIAIACGISDGLGFGTNTKAALLSRGLVEISRLGSSMGAKAKTFSGISGLGDLVTTCISPYSRNRFVGERIGRGKSLKQVTAHMQMVAEGIPTAKSAYALSLKYKVDMPIIREVYAVLYKDKSAKEAVRDLMTRERKEE